MKKTLIIGATDKPEKYANIAANMLVANGHQIVPVGVVDGVVEGEPILKMSERPEVYGVDTVTMYIAPFRQPPLYEYILGLNPKRLIFNPGTENPELTDMAKQRGVEAMDACTLVMLRTGQY